MKALGVWLLVLGLLAGSSGCSVRLPGIGIDIGHGGGGFGHCPPGQAKKGRC